jgi:hypothetical protein
MTPYTPLRIERYIFITQGHPPKWEVYYTNYRSDDFSIMVGGMDELAAFMNALKHLGYLKARADKRRRANQ